MENKKYTASRYGISFYGETLEELANAIKHNYPNANIKTFYPAEWHPLYQVYVAMNYYGYDINTLEKKSSPKKKKNKEDKKPMMTLSVDDIKTLFTYNISILPEILDSSSRNKLKQVLCNVYKNLPEDEKNQIKERYSFSMKNWELE
jgi:hypothetical protein